MKTKTLQRKPASIAKGRWAAYATAGAASAFTCANSAEATIHYSGPINQIFRYLDSATFELDQPGDSISLIHTFATNYQGYAYFGVAGRAGASIAGFYGDCGFPVWASKLPPGQLISRRPFIAAQSAILAIGFPASGSSLCNGEFAAGGIGYVGFKFNNGGGDQYGWVRIRTHRTWQQNFKLIDYAWGDVGDAIRAGQRSSNEMAPEESDGIIPQESPG